MKVFNNEVRLSMFGLVDRCMAMLLFLSNLGIFILQRRDKNLDRLTFGCGILCLELDHNLELSSNFEYRRISYHPTSIGLPVHSNFLVVRGLHLCGSEYNRLQGSFGQDGTSRLGSDLRGIDTR